MHTHHTSSPGITIKTTLNKFGQLWWNTEETKLSMTFLDPKISVIENKLQTATCQKEMNV
jgi:hypothetical protein